MALPTCECVKGLSIGEQLAAIYCATYTLAAGDVDGPYLLKSANLSDVGDPDVSRTNIGAAESGANTDITSLGGVLNIGVNGATPTAETYPKFSVYPSVHQTLSSGNVVDIVAFGSEIFDTANAFSANAFTVPADAAGYYQFNISGLYFFSGGTSAMIIGLYVNGSLVSVMRQDAFTSGMEYGVGAPALVQLAAGDAVTLRAQQVTGTAWQIFGGSSVLGRFSGARLF